MRRSRLLLVMLLAVPREGSAQQTVALDPIRGEVSMSMRGQQTDLPGGAFGGSQTLFEGVSLRGGGSVMSPDLVRFFFALAPRFSQSWFENRPALPYYRNSSRDGQAYGLLGVHLLPKGLLGVDLRASRRRFDVFDRTGRERQREIQEYGAELRLRGRALPTRVFLRRETESEAWQTGSDHLPAYGQERTRVGVEGSNSKTRVFVENLSARDRLDGRDYTFLNSYLHNRQRWGKGSHLGSRLTLTRREQGGLEQTSFLVDEDARLQHTRTLSSSYRFSVGEQSSGPVGTRRLLWEMGLRYAVAGPLTLSLEGRGRHQDFNEGTAFSRERRILPGASLLLRPAQKVTVRAEGQIGYQWSHFEGPSGVLGQVVDERHPIGPELSVTLREDAIDVTTIVVRSAEGSREFQLDFDYAVNVVGQDTHLLILPGGRLAEGDTIAVDYLFAVSAEDKFDGAIANYTLGLGYHGLSLFHTRYLESNSEVMQGSEGRSAFGRDHRLTGASFLARGGLGSLSLRLEHLVTEQRSVRSRNLRASASASTFFTSRILGTLSTSRSQGASGEQRSEILTGETRLDWRPIPGFKVTGRLAGYDSRFDSRVQRYFGGGIGAELDWRATRFTLRIDRGVYEDSSQPGQGRLGTRFWAGVTRTF